MVEGTKENEGSNWRWPLVLVVFVLSVWGVSWWLITSSVFLKGWAERGTFGDMFGAVNALFSGLAFAGVIYAIILQRQELRLQRLELEQTRKELEGQKEQLEEQSKTSKLQRFEVTFFNLLDALDTCVEKVEFRYVFQRGGKPQNIKKEGKDAFGGFISYVTYKLRNGEHDPALNSIGLFRLELAKNSEAFIPFFRTFLAIYELIVSAGYKEPIYWDILSGKMSNKQLAFIYYYLAMGARSHTFNKHLAEVGFFIPLDEKSFLCVNDYSHYVENYGATSRRTLWNQEASTVGPT